MASMCLLLRALFRSFQYSTWGELESLLSLTREVHQYMAFPWKLKVATDTFLCSLTWWHSKSWSTFISQVCLYIFLPMEMRKVNPNFSRLLVFTLPSWPSRSRRLIVLVQNPTILLIVCELCIMLGVSPWVSHTLTPTFSLSQLLLKFNLLCIMYPKLLL